MGQCLHAHSLERKSTINKVVKKKMVQQVENQQQVSLKLNGPNNELDLSHVLIKKYMDSDANRYEELMPLSQLI